MLYKSYIYIIYTPNLGLVIAVFVLRRGHGRFRGSTKGAPREQGEYAGRRPRTRKSEARGSLNWALRTRTFVNLPGSASYYLGLASYPKPSVEFTSACLGLSGLFSREKARLPSRKSITGGERQQRRPYQPPSRQLKNRISGGL